MKDESAKRVRTAKYAKQTKDDGWQRFHDVQIMKYNEMGHAFIRTSRPTQPALAQSYGEAKGYGTAIFNRRQKIGGAGRI